MFLDDDTINLKKKKRENIINYRTIYINYQKIINHFLIFIFYYFKNRRLQQDLKQNKKNKLQQ